MGMTQTVVLPDPMLSWERVRERLAAEGVSVQMRMIDGQLAFPDEEPPENWREIRVGGAGGMVSVRRTGQGVDLVVWGNADAGLTRLWNTLARTFAAAGGGQIISPHEPRS